MKRTLNLNLNNKDVLIVADMQKDFLPGGALPVKDGDQLIPVINDYIAIFKPAKAKIVASKDWHPANHISFVQQGGPWPPHCVQGSEGATFHLDLKIPDDVYVVSKATDPKKEAYSVFDGTGLTEKLESWGVRRVFISGLATDYCIVNSALDARKLGLEVVVLADATRGIDVHPGDVEKAFQTMAEAGATQATLEDFPEIEPLPITDITAEKGADKPLVAHEARKKARMRPRGSLRVRSERG